MFIVQSDRQQFGSMASTSQKFILIANNSIFGPWPLANPWRQQFILISNNSNLGGKCSYRFDRQQNDPAILGGQIFILIANHPIRGGEISSPAIRPLDHWPLAAKVHSCRQQIRSLAAKVLFDRANNLGHQFDPWRPQNHFNFNFDSVPLDHPGWRCGGVACGTVRKRDEGRSARWAHTFLICKDVVKKGEALIH